MAEAAERRNDRGGCRLPASIREKQGAANLVHFTGPLRVKGSSLILATLKMRRVIHSPLGSGTRGSLLLRRGHLIRTKRAREMPRGHLVRRALLSAAAHVRTYCISVHCNTVATVPQVEASRKFPRDVIFRDVT